MEWSLGVAALASFAAGAVFLRMGWHLRGDAGPGQDGRALRAWSIWWAGIGAATATVGIRLLLGAVDRTGAVPLVQTVGIVFTGGAMWGLLAYLGYIYTGRMTVGRIAAWSYGILVTLTVAFIAWAAPHEVVVRSWTVESMSVGAPLGSAMDIILMLAFLVPPIIAGALILRLLPNIQDAAQRRRILAVGIGIPLWILVHVAARVSDADAWQFIARVVLGLAVALTIAWAYGVGPRRPERPVDAGFEARVRALV